MDDNWVQWLEVVINVDFLILIGKDTLKPLKLVQLRR